MGCVYERVTIDSGIDGTIELRDPSTNEMLNLVIRAQIKATGSLDSETESQFSFTCTQADIDYWLKGNTPNILIVCKPATREAYWKCIRSTFATPEKRNRRTVRFDKREDRFDESARQALFELARPRDSGLYMEAPRKGETLFSNLFEIRALPPRVYRASTQCSKLKQVYAVAADKGISLPPEIIYTANTILTVHDPRTRHDFTDVCEIASSEGDKFENVFDLEDPVSRNNAAELLLKCLQGLCIGLGLRYRHNKKRDHRLIFAPYVKAQSGGRLSKQTRSFHSGSGDGSGRLRGLVSPLDRKGTGKIKGLKHHAFHADVHYFDDHWYVQVSPTYLYTIDGWRKKRSSAELLSGIKRRERNRAVFSNLRMWEEFLLDNNGGDLLRQPYPHLKLGPLVYFASSRGIPDEAWHTESEELFEEREEEFLLERLFQ
jgi:hypothetical protein